MTEALHEGLEADAVAAAPGFARFTTSSAVFAFGSVVGKAVGFLMLPILTRALTPSGFGSMDVLISLESAIAAPLLLGLDVATVRLYFDQRDDGARARLIGTSYAITLGGAAGAGAIIALASGTISEALFGSATLQPAVLATGAAVLGGVLQFIALTVLRVQGRAGRYAAVTTAAIVGYALLAIALLALWRADVTAVLVAYAAALLLSGVVASILVGLGQIGRPTASAARVLLRLGLPLMPAVAATYGADFLNRAILLGTGGAANVALFTVALRFASVAGIVVTGFQLAWPPRAFALGTSDAARRRLAIDAQWVVAIVGSAVLTLAVASPDIVVFVAGPAYGQALPALGFCLTFILAEALFLVASLPSAVARATRDIAIATGTSVVVALVGNLVLSRAWQSAGTAAAVLTGQLVGVVVVRALGHRRLALPVDWWRIGIVSGAIGIATVGMLVGGAPLGIRILVAVPVLGLVAWSVPLREALGPIRQRLGR